MNTHPDGKTGPEWRRAFQKGKKVPVTFDDRCEVYHLKHSVWKQAGMRAWNGCLCVGCVEERLGRQLRPKDFARDESWAAMPCTARLLDRRGFKTITAMTDGGEQEFIVDKKTAAKMAAEIPPGELPYITCDRESVDGSAHQRWPKRKPKRKRKR